METKSEKVIPLRRMSVICTQDEYGNIIPLTASLMDMLLYLTAGAFEHARPIKVRKRDFSQVDKSVVVDLLRNRKLDVRLL